MTYRNLFTNFAKSLRCQALESKTFHDVNRKTWGSKNLQIITPKKYLGIHKRKNFGDGAIIHNVSGLADVAAIYELFVMKCSAWKSAGFSIKVKTSNGFKPVL